MRFSSGYGLNRISDCGSIKGLVCSNNRSSRKTQHKWSAKSAWCTKCSKD